MLYTMTTIVKANGPADILAMIPSMVGFIPRNSVVLLAFRGKRTCGAMRFDLPGAGGIKVDAKIHKRFATTIVGTLCKLPTVDAVITVIYTDEEFAGGTAIPRAEFATVLGRRIELSGFEHRGSITHASDGWASHFEPRVPPGGHPLSDIAESSASAQIPEDERESPNPLDLPKRVPNAEPSAMARTKKRLAMYRRLADSVGDDDSEAPAALAPIYDIPLFAEDALTWDAAATESFGALLAFMVQGPPVRDLVMLQWASDLAVGDQLWEEGSHSDQVQRTAGVDIGGLMVGQYARPDPDRIERGIALLLHLVAQLADAKRPPLLCMLAWLNWALGRSSRAAVYLDEALAIDPQYSMAQLLNTMLRNGMLPEWAFAEPKQSASAG
jgi:hypothetical protein